MRQGVPNHDHWPTRHLPPGPVHLSLLDSIGTEHALDISDTRLETREAPRQAIWGRGSSILWPTAPSRRARLTRGVGSGQHLASVLQEGRENANIDAYLRESRFSRLQFLVLRHWRSSYEQASARPASV